MCRLLSSRAEPVQLTRLNSAANGTYQRSDIVCVCICVRQLPGVDRRRTSSVVATENRLFRTTATVCPGRQLAGWLLCWLLERNLGSHFAGRAKSSSGLSKMKPIGAKKEKNGPIDANDVSNFLNCVDRPGYVSRYVSLFFLYFCFFKSFFEFFNFFYFFTVFFHVFSLFFSFMSFTTTSSSTAPFSCSLPFSKASYSKEPRHTRKHYHPAEQCPHQTLRRSLLPTPA